jgi:hypothetical protein
MFFTKHYDDDDDDPWGRNVFLICNDILLHNKYRFHNKPDALIIQIYSVIKLHVSGIHSAHHQEFSTVHSALLSFIQFFDDRFQTESGRNILSLLGSGYQNLHETYQYRIYSKKLLVMVRENARNM